MQTNLRLDNNSYKSKVTLTAIVFIAVGVFVRVIGFGQIPNGFNQDEAFAAYESYSLLNYGIDSAGNRLPTFFVSWGSGMNVLESYLAIPFMWLFGYSEAVFRLPQLILAISTLPVFFLLLKRLFGDKTALIGLGILAVSPWHIMLSRWGLESNLAPALTLLGLFFLLKGIQKNGYLLLSALFYGLSLYSYSITWISVPVMLALFGIYLLKSRIKIKWYFLLGAALILFLFALPHILFLLINGGILPEIKTSFITIPRLVQMRSDEISAANIFSTESYKNLFKVLFAGRDGGSWNSLPEYGIFYHISQPFLIIGIVKLLRLLVRNLGAKKIGGEYFILGGFLTFLIVALFISNLNVNKANGMHLFTLAIIAVGVNTVIDRLHKRRWVAAAITLSFALYFVSFFGCYFYNGGVSLKGGFAAGVGDSVEYVNDKKCESVAVDGNIPHSFILFYDKTPAKDFTATVRYKNYPDKFLKAEAFDKYSFGIEYNRLGDFDAYIFPLDHIYFFYEDEFEIEYFGEFGVAVRREFK